MSQSSHYQLCNAKLILKCDINEKNSSKPLHLIAALITKPSSTDPLLPQAMTLLVASASFKVQRVKDTSVHLSQTGRFMAQLPELQLQKSSQH